jgi:hypothetical protein
MDWVKGRYEKSMCKEIISHERAGTEHDTYKGLAMQKLRKGGS